MRPQLSHWKVVSSPMSRALYQLGLSRHPSFTGNSNLSSSEWVWVSASLMASQMILNVRIACSIARSGCIPRFSSSLVRNRVRLPVFPSQLRTPCLRPGGPILYSSCVAVRPRSSHANGTPFSTRSSTPLSDLTRPRRTATRFLASSSVRDHGGVLRSVGIEM